MIEPCWPWLKKETCKTGVPKTREDMIKKWKEEQENFPQSKLQEFVARIPCYLQIVRFLKGDNKYRDGRIDGRSDTKWGKQLLTQLEADMAIVKAFESFNRSKYYHTEMIVQEYLQHLQKKMAILKVLLKIVVKKTYKDRKSVV